ncbi:hypothetical protein F8568_024195 [Actinomadura sp. LD22]|uniref:Uncharacterized protein n=1 Tax=Actinomadura physcomitrii TaxID=2650748 RepID=A0A6I4MCJ9_9ACTN|nr:hypothetical protein [Actinomadura physcomitrii]MWA03423.1 hypothetical protein [Actinomadura physcomitrii]
MSSVHPRQVLDELQRLRRRLGFDRNDLRRAADRRQWAAGPAAAVSFATIAPPPCAGIVSATYQSGVRTEAAQTASHLAVGGAAASGVQVVRIGQSGADAVWHGVAARPGAR